MGTCRCKIKTGSEQRDPSHLYLPVALRKSLSTISCVYFQRDSMALQLFG